MHKKQQFLNQLKTDNYSENTIKGYQKDLQKLKTFLDSQNLTPKNIKRQHITKFKSSLDLAPTTINRILSSVRNYIKFLKRNDIPTKLDPEQIKMTKTRTKKKRVPPLSTIKNLISHPTKAEVKPRVAKRNRAMLETIFSTGIRVSELINLDRSDIEDGNKLFILGKGNKERWVYLTERAQKHLQSYFDTRTDTHAPAFISYSSNAKNNKRISKRYIQNKIQQYREQLDIDYKITAHTLRHAFATYMAQEGASTSTIQTMLGHESLDTTTKYINISDRYAQQAHQQFHPFKN